MISYVPLKTRVINDLISKVGKVYLLKIRLVTHNPSTFLPEDYFLHGIKVRETNELINIYTCLDDNPRPGIDFADITLLVDKPVKDRYATLHINRVQVTTVECRQM